jgi:hypothetical protein
VITLAVFVVAVLANARLSRLVSIDDVFIPAWAWAEKKYKLKRLMKLSWCHWCSGVWTSGLLVTPPGLALAAWVHHWPVWLPFALWLHTTLAVAYASSFLIGKESGDGSAT